MGRDWLQFAMLINRRGHELSYAKPNQRKPCVRTHIIRSDSLIDYELIQNRRWAHSRLAKSDWRFTIGVEKRAGMLYLRISIFFALLMPVRLGDDLAISIPIQLTRQESRK